MSEQPAPVLMDTLRPLVARVAHHPVEQLAADTAFTSLGRWGSLAAMRLLATVEQTYGVQLDLRAYMRLATVGELAGEIDRLRTPETQREQAAPTPAG
ncbi:acyl carrier protein [Streptomyces sp. NPDC044571]|uniref:acyl carrier protein n=1 Tax=Streptomyces sp. NPDC044571 TaxID=3155371 RepID=UPI003404D310